MKSLNETIAKTRLKSYINSLDNTRQLIFKNTLKDLRGRGDSWEFIYTGITYKGDEVWQRYGYGLMFSNSYRAQIKNLLENKEQDDVEIESLFDDEEEAPTFTEPDYIDADKAQELTNSSEPLFYKMGNEGYTFNELKEILESCPTPKETFNMLWGRYPENDKAICYYEEQLSSLI